MVIYFLNCIDNKLQIIFVSKFNKMNRGYVKYYT